MACVDLETRTIATGSLKKIWKLMNFRKSVPFNRKLWDENYLGRKFIFPLLRKKLKFREFKPGIFTEGKEPIVFMWETNRRTREETTSWPCQPLMSSGAGFEPAPHCPKTTVHFYPKHRTLIRQINRNLLQYG